MPKKEIARGGCYIRSEIAKSRRNLEDEKTNVKSNGIEKLKQQKRGTR
jgi:hypothetical protein